MIAPGLYPLRCVSGRFLLLSTHTCPSKMLSVTSFKRCLKPSRWTKAVNRTRRNDCCDFWAHISDLNSFSSEQRGERIDPSIYSTNTNAGIRSVFFILTLPLDVHLILNEKWSPSLRYETHLKLPKGLFYCVNSHCVTNFQIHDDPAHKSWLCLIKAAVGRALSYWDLSYCVSHQSQNLQYHTACRFQQRKCVKCGWAMWKLGHWQDF